MTREEVLNQILHHSGLGEEVSPSSPYTYSRPVAFGANFNVPLASTVSGVAAQSYGGRGLGGGFPFLPIGNVPTDGFNADENAYENAAENAAWNSNAAQNAQELANANANAARNAQQLRQQMAQEQAQEAKQQFAFDAPFEKPQIATQREIMARGESAVEQMKEYGRILRGEQLSAEQMETAENAAQMQFGRFSDTAIEEQVRRTNPTANAQQVKAKAEEIKTKIADSAESVTQKDFEIDFKDWREMGQGFELPEVKTEVASTGRDFSNPERIKATERTINGQTSVGYNKPIKDNRNLFQKGFDYMTKTAQQKAENPLPEIASYALAAPALGAIGSAIGASVAPVASNILQFPTAAKAATAASALTGTVLNFPTSAAAETVSPKQQFNFSTSAWDAGTQRLNTLTTPSVQSAAEKVASKLQNTTSSANKLTTKEKRLGKL